MKIQKAFASPMATALEKLFRQQLKEQTSGKQTK
jgi:hypothetical protein